MEILIFPKHEEKAKQMERYMKNHFPFAGVPKPERAKRQKPVLTESKSLPISELLSLATYYYEQLEREYQYLAIDLIQQNVKRLSLKDLAELTELVQKKEWWDSIDSWRKVYSTWSKLHLDQLEAVYLLFAEHEDFWLRRMAITLQLGFRGETNNYLLEKAIEYDRSTNEFFIQKAIGWSLRDYSKTNASWVKGQIEKEWSPLARREAGKYL